MSSLTMADLDMIDDALFQRAGDARNDREEDRWMALRGKVAKMAIAVERAKCECGHARKSHRGDGRDRCVICHCASFAAEARSTDTTEGSD